MHLDEVVSSIISKFAYESKPDITLGREIRDYQKAKWIITYIVEREGLLEREGATKVYQISGWQVCPKEILTTLSLYF